MATQNGTIKGVTLLSATPHGGGTRKAYLLAVDFPAYTGASDDASITGVGAAIAAHVRNGKTNTLRGALCAQPGLDTAQQAVYATAPTVSSDDLTTFNLANAAGAELATATASEGVGIIATVDES